ncbi:hypothetical protein [Winogradskyella sp.]|uniref:hypothetical protein n=1 Tax=Winogradskyella sp. TaxID=1883156 RepID=UPI003BAA8CA4
MSRLEPNATLKELRNSEVKKSTRKTKIGVALIFLVLTVLITLSYMNGNIFMEYLAICTFIISCIAIIKLMETNQN